MFGFYAVGLRLCKNNRNLKRNNYACNKTLEFFKNGEWAKMEIWSCYT